MMVSCQRQQAGQPKARSKVLVPAAALTLIAAVWYHGITGSIMCTRHPVTASSAQLQRHSSLVGAYATSQAGGSCAEWQRSGNSQMTHHPYLHPLIDSQFAASVLIEGQAAAGTLNSSKHVTTPNNSTVAGNREALQKYLASPEFEAIHAGMIQQQRQHNRRGIVVAAGGKRTSHLVVLLQVLRKHLNCTLPVEVVWQGKDEMVNSTMHSLQKLYGPLSGFDVTTKPYPRPFQRKGWNLKGYVGKVAALLHSSFHEAILLDADNLPVIDPALQFSDPLYQQSGNMFWPDYWKGWVHKEAFPFLGLDQAVEELLIAGGGWSERDAEAGMVVIDRTRWLAVLHWVFWINTWHDPVYSMMLGDKDTFALGFALAGHADQYRQVCVPPGAAFTWAPGWLECARKNDTDCQPGDGWRLLAMMQHDNYGRPAYFHRTALKFELGRRPYPAQLITGPLPFRWIVYYIAHGAAGPFRGKDSTHVAPASAFDMLHIDSTPIVAIPSEKGSLQHFDGRLKLAPSMVASSDTASRTAAGRLDINGSTDVEPRICPVVLFSQYVQAMRLALPIDPQPWLECACRHLVQHLLHSSNGTTGMMDGPLLPLTPEYLHGMAKNDQGKAIADNSRVPALRVSRPYDNNVLMLSATLRTIVAAEAAFIWLASSSGRSAFPALF